MGKQREFRWLPLLIFGMALATYNDLCASVALWTHRTDLTSVIPDWVTLCETTINYGDGDQISGLKTAAQEKTATLTCSPGTQTVVLPADLLEIRRIYITFGNIRRELIGRPVAPIAITDSVQVNSIPETFFVTGSTLYLVPIPNQSYVITLLYYAKVGPLATQGTNWLMTAAPMVYLAGTILHGVPFFGAQFNPAPWSAAFRVGMKQVQDNDQSRFANIRLRSGAAAMTGSGYSYADFLAGT